MATRICMPIMLALAFAAAAGSAQGQGGAKAPAACNVLTEKDAGALAGSPLPSVDREETKPTQTSSSHTTTCAYFPKGYDIRKADRPPELGIELRLHVMRSREDAREFYDAALGMAENRGKSKTDTKPVPLAGTGEAAFLQARKLEPQPGNVYDIAYVRLVKGSVMAQVTAWTKGASADAIAKAAAKQVAARLP